MANSIDILIEKCQFSPPDVTLATHGECMYFALALHQLLESRQIPSELTVASLNFDWHSWAHAMVRYRRSYYDIRGRVIIKAIHLEYKTKFVKKCAREDFAGYYTMNPHGANRIDFWYQLLQKG